jgi:hypothetical protein
MKKKSKKNNKFDFLAFAVCFFISFLIWFFVNGHNSKKDFDYRKYQKLRVEKTFVEENIVFKSNDIVYLVEVDSLGGNFPWGVSKANSKKRIFMSSSNFNNLSVISNYKRLP